MRAHQKKEKNQDPRSCRDHAAQQYMQMQHKNEFFVRVELFLCGWKESKRNRGSLVPTGTDFDVGLAPEELRRNCFKGTLVQRIQGDGTATFDDLRITLTTSKMRKLESVMSSRLTSANYCLGFQLLSRGEAILREMVLTKPISVVHRTTIWRYRPRPAASPCSRNARAHSRAQGRANKGASHDAAKP